MSNITFTCPSGGKWYTCPSGSFVGCCGVDPCSNGCKQGDLQPGGFPLADHGTFSDASCETGSNFWTCAPSASQTFWGCCKSNPCNNTPAATCRQGDLTPAFLGSPEKKAAYLGADEQGGKKSNGAVIGGAIGGGLGAAIIIGVLIFFFCRRRKRNQKVAHAESGANASTPMMKDGFQDNNRLSTQFGQSPPPTYSSPDPNFYQSMSPAKGNPYQPSQQMYGHEGAAPQELPAELASPAQNRYSELPAEASSSGANRYSELPAGATQTTAELESPQTSPRPMQTEFSHDMAKHANSSTGDARK
ncbi:hypothetical protein IQ06DRAFT_301213 [Phaeosphaeriaceae sp. SRC1lsM3a]|nr:hypothetical protein IQ06DRAFT_301213 [Stagonospora sp. SRC1lsM3a]